VRGARALQSHREPRTSHLNYPRDAGDRLNLKRWLPPIIWAGVILTATSIPSSVIPRGVSEFDKVVHFTIYALFAVLLGRSLSEVTTRWRAAILAIVISAVFGAVDEWHQQFVRGRFPDRADLLADTLGAVGGAFTVAALQRRTTTTPAIR
jgi:VanZ family protein